MILSTRQKAAASESLQAGLSAAHWQASGLALILDAINTASATARREVRSPGAGFRVTTLDSDGNAVTDVIAYFDYEDRPVIANGAALDTVIGEPCIIWHPDSSGIAINSEAAAIAALLA